MKLLIRLFFKTIRLVMGPVILFINWITMPRGIKRDTEAQARIDEATRNLTVYEFKTCPFCIKTRRAMKRLSLNVERRDAQHNPQHREELLKAGGKVQVPCLRVVDEQGDEQWIYESSTIINYLNNRFAA